MLQYNIQEAYCYREGIFKTKNEVISFDIPSP